MRWRIALAVTGMLALAVGCLTLDHYPVGVFHDDAMYVVLARAIANGRGYRWINLPDAPAASHFPPGLPLVLALIWRAWPVFPANVVAFKAFNVLCFAATSVLAAQLVRERLASEGWGLAAGILAAVAVPSLVLTTMVLSEPLFLAIALGTLLMAERAPANAPRHAFVAGLLAGSAMLVRMHGAALAIGIIGVLLLRRRARDAGAAALGTLAVVLPWQLWARVTTEPLAPPIAGNYGSYLAWWMRGFHELGARMLSMTASRTCTEVTSMMVSLFSPGRSAPVHALTLVALAIALVSTAFVLSKRMPVTALFLVLYLAVVVVWPFPPSRFLWGIWPLVLLIIIGPAREVAGRASWIPPVRVVVGLSCAWLAVGYAMYEVRAVRGRWWSSIARASTPRIDGAVAFATAHTAPGDIISADDEGAVFLYTGRHTVPVLSFTVENYLLQRSPVVETEEGLRPLIERYPVHAVIVGSEKSFQAAQLLAAPPGPELSPPMLFPGGAAFTVLSR